MLLTRLQPLYYGYIGLTKDALLIIQEILHKHLELVPRRPHERERPLLIQLGNVFVFIEEQLGIKRWTDGIAWLPSRILGRFLVYRELDKQLLLEKDDRKKKRRKTVVLAPALVAPPPMPAPLALPNMPSMPTSSFDSTHFFKPEQSLMATPYVFKDKGLIKKTLSLTTTSDDLHSDGKLEKQTIHLISYYNAEDVLNGKLLRPSEGDFKHQLIAPGLWNAVKDLSLGGKIPIEDEAHYFLDNNYQLSNMLTLSQKPPVPQMGYQAPHPGVPQQWAGPHPQQYGGRMYMDYTQAPPRHNSVPQSSLGYEEQQHPELATVQGLMSFNNPFPMYYAPQPGAQQMPGSQMPPGQDINYGFPYDGSALAPAGPSGGVPTNAAPVASTLAVATAPEYQSSYLPATSLLLVLVNGALQPLQQQNPLVLTPLTHLKPWAPSPAAAQPNGWYTASSSLGEDCLALAAPIYSPAHHPTTQQTQTLGPVYASYQPTAAAGAPPMEDGYYKSNNAFI